jgi:hypothetical protein
LKGTKQLEKEVPCPNCGHLVRAVVRKETIQKAVKGVYEWRLNLDKTIQTTLDEAPAAPIPIQ